MIYIVFLTKNKSVIRFKFELFRDGEVYDCSG